MDSEHLLTESIFYYKFKGKSGKPIVPIILKHSEKEIKLSAVIDSGADYSIFDAASAEQIGIPVTRFEQLKINGIAASVTGNLCKVKAKVLDQFFEMPVLFVRNYAGPFNILGRSGFFEKHIITFNEAKLEIKIAIN